MSVARNALSVLRGSTVAQLLQFALLPVLTRLADPAAFGALALFVGAGAVLSLLSVLRYDIAIVVARSERQALALAVLVRFLGALSAIFTLMLALPLLAYGFDFNWVRSIEMSTLMTVFLLVTAEYKIVVARLNRSGLFSWLGATHLVGALGTMLSQLVLLRAGIEPALALMSGYVLGQALALFSCITASWDRFRGKKFSIESQHILAVARRYSEYPRYSLAFGVLMQSRDRALHLVMSAFAGTNALGAFSLAQRVTSAPYILMHGGMGPAVLSYARTVPGDSVARIAGTALEATYVLFVPVFLALAFNANDITSIVFGPAWSEAGPMMTWLTLPYLLLACAAFLDRLFVYYGHQRSALALEGACAVALLAAVAVSGLSGSALAMTMSFSLVYAVYLIIWVFLAFRINGLPIEHLKGVLRSVILATPLTALVNISLMSVENAIARILIAVLAGGVMFYAYVKYLSDTSKLAMLFEPSERSAVRASSPRPGFH